jgi:hypothetical protein
MSAQANEPLVLEGMLGELKDALDRVADSATQSGKYRFAAEVEEIARRLIAEHHPHLASAKIAYLMADKLPPVKGRPRGGAAAKATERERLLHGYDFVITINREVWLDLTPEQREALVDHELSHCGVTADGSWTIWPHDLEEFAAVVKRHGLWSEGVRAFGKAMAEQLQFDLA